MLAPKIRTRTDKRKQFAGVRTRARNIRAMSIPRLSDILRAQPSILQTAAGESLRMLSRAVGDMNGQRVAAGGRKFDMPGLIRHSRRASGPMPKPGLFRPNVRLNPSMVSDRRLNTPVENRAGWNGRLRVGRLPNILPVPPLRRVNPTSVPRATLSASARSSANRTRKRLALR